MTEISPESPATSSNPSSMNPDSRFPARLFILLAMPITGLVMALLVIINNPGLTGTTTTGSNLPNGSINGSASTMRPPGIMNQPAPDFTLTTLDGSKTVTLKDYLGRVVFINFWGTWCPPCVEELPTLQKFASEQGNTGAVVLAINSSETPDVITPFLTDNKIILSSIPVLMDSDYSVFQQYGVYNMPTTYVITPDGIVKNVKYGGITPETLQAYLDEALGKGSETTTG
ncbi:MAG TPA: TlpA disulfide reductase family protein [Phototrophicaceae bacterium]|nr:TlpA disulfide reductase family protein [Phototrophicaceae bacterium]